MCSNTKRKFYPWNGLQNAACDPNIKKMKGFFSASNEGWSQEKIDWWKRQKNHEKSLRKHFLALRSKLRATAKGLQSNITTLNDFSMIKETTTLTFHFLLFPQKQGIVHKRIIVCTFSPCLTDVKCILSCYYIFSLYRSIKPELSFYWELGRNEYMISWRLHLQPKNLYKKLERFHTLNHSFLECLRLR